MSKERSSDAFDDFLRISPNFDKHEETVVEEIKGMQMQVKGSSDSSEDLVILSFL